MSKTFISDGISGVLVRHHPVNNSEPELARRSGALISSIEQVIDDHKVVSFDVFDTLLARRVERPTDVFDYLGNVFNLPQFQAARIKAEELARKRYGKAGCPEIALEQIYGILNDIMPSLKFGPSEELAAEQKFLFADPAIRIILDVARAKKKRVIAISDMYLSGEQISRLLVANGIEVDAVYSSADHRLAGLGKFNGRMYSFVATTERVESGDIVHFGDNIQADVINARLCGVTGIHIKSRRDEINSEQVPFLRGVGKAKNFTMSLVSGQVAAKMPHLRTGSTSLFTYGYCYAGPLIAGFCTFLQRKAKEDNIDKLVLLARDGYVMERALKILKLNLPSYQVMPISRRMAIFPVLNEDRGLVDRTLFAGLPDGLTPRAYWQLLDLDSSIISSRDDVDRGMSRMDFLSRYSEVLQDASRSERKLLEKHLKAWIGPNPEKTALVDVGWGLTTIRAIDTIIGESYKGYFLGKQASGYHRIGLSGYLFDRQDDTNVEHKLSKGLELIELIFSDPRPGFSRLRKGDDGMECHMSETSADEKGRALAISDVTTGALEFLSDFADVLQFTNPNDLQNLCRTYFEDLILHPSGSEYRALADVPHSRAAGHRSWHRIRDFWGSEMISDDSSSAGEVIEDTVLRQRLTQYDRLLPLSLRRLSMRSDISELNWVREMRRHPLKFSYWNAIRRYNRKLRKN